MTEDKTILDARIHGIRNLCGEQSGTQEYYQAAGLALAVLHDTVGGGHPLMVELRHALQSSDYHRAVAASRAVIALYDEDGLASPRLAIAHEIEADILDAAQSQLEAADGNSDEAQTPVRLAIAAFLAGASLEDSLRRLCDAGQHHYDPQRTSISKLQAALYRPSEQVEVISLSEYKHITAWGDTRNKADHGRFNEITHTEVLAMVLGVRGFIDKHLP